MRSEVVLIVLFFNCVLMWTRFLQPTVVVDVLLIVMLDMKIMAIFTAAYLVQCLCIFSVNNIT